VLVGAESDRMSHTGSCSGDSEDQQGKGSGGTGGRGGGEGRTQRRTRKKRRGRRTRRSTCARKSVRPRSSGERCAEASPPTELRSLASTLMAMGFPARPLPPRPWCPATAPSERPSTGSRGRRQHWQQHWQQQWQWSGSGQCRRGRQGGCRCGRHGFELKLDLSSEPPTMAELEAKTGLGGPTSSAPRSPARGTSSEWRLSSGSARAPPTPSHGAPAASPRCTDTQSASRAPPAPARQRAPQGTDRRRSALASPRRWALGAAWVQLPAPTL